MMCDAALWSTRRRATSKPVSPGICTSRNMTSGWSRSIVVSASRPLPAWPITSPPPTWPRRYPSSSRASCSSSTRTAFKLTALSSRLSSRHALGRGELRDLDAGAGAGARHARELEVIIRAVDHPQALVHVAQPDAVAEREAQALFRHAEPIVVDLDDHAAVPRHRL